MEKGSWRMTQGRATADNPRKIGNMSRADRSQFGPGLYRLEVKNRRWPRASKRSEDLEGAASPGFDLKALEEQVAQQRIDEANTQLTPQERRHG